MLENGEPKACSSGLGLIPYIIINMKATNAICEVKAYLCTKPVILYKAINMASFSWRDRRNALSPRSRERSDTTTFGLAAKQRP